MTEFQYPSTEIMHRCESSIYVIKQAARDILTGVVTIGTELMHVKETLGYTQFTPWLETNFNWSCATAENYMNAARAVDQYPHQAPLCSLQTLYLLTSQLPQEVKDEIMQTPASFNEARLIISAHKAAAWKDAVEKGILVDPGVALREIERVLERDDPVLRGVAAELLRDNAERFALLSDREPREVMVEGGLTLEEQYPGTSKVNAQLTNNMVDVWVSGTRHTIISFWEQVDPIAEAAQNAAIRAVCKELNINEYQV